MDTGKEPSFLITDDFNRDKIPDVLFDGIGPDHCQQEELGNLILKTMLKLIKFSTPKHGNFILFFLVFVQRLKIGFPFLVRV